MFQRGTEPCLIRPALVHSAVCWPALISAQTLWRRGLGSVFPLGPQSPPSPHIPPYWQLLVWVSLYVFAIQLCGGAENIVFWVHITAWILFYSHWSVSCDLGSPQTRGRLNGALWHWHEPMTTLVCSLSPSWCYYWKLGSAYARKW